MSNITKSQQMRLVNTVSREMDGLGMIPGSVKRYNNKGEILYSSSLFTERKLK